MTRQSRPLGRRTETRAPKRKFILFTEGRNTEPGYFEALSRHLGGALIELEIIKAAGVPMTIAQSAATRAKVRKGRSSFDETDKVWAVFDRDDHHKVDEAIAKCRGAKVGVAYSNPCFELWLILHREEFHKPDGRHDVQQHCGQLFDGYHVNGGKILDWLSILAEVELAEARAEAQLAKRKEEGEPPGPPFTTVFELTREIRLAHAAFTGAA